MSIITYKATQISNKAMCLTFIIGCYTLSILVDIQYWHYYVSEDLQFYAEELEYIANEEGFYTNGTEYIPNIIEQIILEDSISEFNKDTYDTYLYEKEYRDMYLNINNKVLWNDELILETDFPF